MSAPAAKALSDPVTTMAPMASSASKAATACPSSAIRPFDSAFMAFGRLSVISPTLPRVSTRMF